jgi:hypothetical protein
MQYGRLPTISHLAKRLDTNPQLFMASRLHEIYFNSETRPNQAIIFDKNTVGKRERDGSATRTLWESEYNNVTKLFLIETFPW